mmetsp:Transcript_60456/g.74096  ORF Transcript_60456/g.74096 Transcript_60456/m.74096 type:complete len:367 (+) Transcript_60456:17-1117(+)
MARFYSEKQETILVTLNVIASILSFFGALFIISNYIIFEDLRNFAFQLILFVAIGDMINCIGNFMGSPDVGPLCTFQGIVIQFGDLTSFGWVTAIAWSIYTILTREIPPTKADAVRWFKRMHYIIWPTTFILAIFPLILGVYGPNGGLCWITGSVEGEVARWLSFYLPLWGALVYMTFVYCKVWKDLQKTTSKSTNDGNTKHNTQTSDNDLGQITKQATDLDDTGAAMQPKESNSNVFDQQTTSNIHSSTDNVSNKGGGMLQRIKFYPVILFICYLPATIRRLYEFASPGFPTQNETPFFLSALTVIMSSLLGFCNAMLYGTTPQVKDRDKEYIKRKCFGVQTDRGSSNDNETNNENDVELGNELR